MDDNGSWFGDAIRVQIIKDFPQVIHPDRDSQEIASSSDNCYDLNTVVVGDDSINHRAQNHNHNNGHLHKENDNHLQDYHIEHDDNNYADISGANPLVDCNNQRNSNYSNLIELSKDDNNSSKGELNSDNDKQSVINSTRHFQKEQDSITTCTNLLPLINKNCNINKSILTRSSRSRIDSESKNVGDDNNNNNIQISEEYINLDDTYNMIKASIAHTSNDPLRSQQQRLRTAPLISLQDRHNNYRHGGGCFNGVKIETEDTAGGLCDDNDDDDGIKGTTRTTPGQNDKIVNNDRFLHCRPQIHHQRRQINYSDNNATQHFNNNTGMTASCTDINNRTMLALGTSPVHNCHQHHQTSSNLHQYYNHYNENNQLHRQSHHPHHNVHQQHNNEERENSNHVITISFSGRQSLSYNNDAKGQETSNNEYDNSDGGYHAPSYDFNRQYATTSSYNRNNGTDQESETDDNAKGEYLATHCGHHGARTGSNVIMQHHQQMIADQVAYTTPPRRRPGRPRGSRRKKPEKLGRLWEFIRDLLLSPESCPSLICWDNYDEGMFRFVHSDKVAKLWGAKRDNPDMNYEKLSRAMRYYYKSNVLQPVFGRRLVYKFGPEARGWRTENPNFTAL